MADQLVEAAKNLLEACYQADARGELDDAVTGELMMAVRDALIAAPTTTQLSQAVEAAKGAMIEAAAQIVKQVGKRAELDFPNDLGNHASRTCDHIEESIRALQTEPMAAALAARDDETFIKGYDKGWDAGKQEIAEATKELREQLARTEQHFDEATTALVIFKLNAETEIAGLRLGIAEACEKLEDWEASLDAKIAEAVKAAEEATYIKIVSAFESAEDPTFQDMGKWFRKNSKPPSGYLDRYVASKVREAKKPLLEAADYFYNLPRYVGVGRDEDYDRHRATIAAERKEAGQ